MNERIAELAIQAGGVWSGGYVEQSNGNSVWTDKKFVEDVDPEKFAELIVKECAELFNKNETDIRIPEYLIHDSIMIHFGLY